MILPHGDAALREAARRTAEGGLVAFRTDTFYGLGADPFNTQALERINALKGRDGKPILVVVSDALMVARFVAGETEAFRALAAEFWPGALTLVLRARREVPELITAGTGTIGVRLPADEEVRELVGACGGALTATSANPAGAPPARAARDVETYFGDSLPLVIDGGETTSERPSSVVDVTGDGASLIREGVVTADSLERALRPRGIELRRPAP